MEAEKQRAKQLVVGILAHVDSGKTTLSEAMLYRSGTIRKLGRVDHKDAFLDTDALEKARGITIFSKQALLTAGETAITLLDTPGHVDFSTETERTLQVLDYAVLVISGTDGVKRSGGCCGGIISQRLSSSTKWICPAPAKRNCWNSSTTGWARALWILGRTRTPGTRRWLSAMSG